MLDRALVAGDAGGVTGERERPDPEVPEKARRRSFTAQYKLDVAAEYDEAATGEKGAVLRREGLYSSHVRMVPRSQLPPVPCSPVQGKHEAGSRGGRDKAESDHQDNPCPRAQSSHRGDQPVWAMLALVMTPLVT